MNSNDDVVGDLLNATHFFLSNLNTTATFTTAKLTRQAIE